MGNIELNFATDKGMIFELPGELCVVANADDLAGLESSSAFRNLTRTVLVPLTADAPLPVELLANAKVLVVEVDPAVPASVRRVSQIRNDHQDLRIIAAMGRADVSLVRTLIRQGISDVATLPFNGDELVTQLLEAMAPLRRKALDPSLAPVVTVVRSIGGCGATTLATHLAAAIAAESNDGKGVCLIDLDVQSGATSSYLGLSPKASVMALLEASDRLDDELLRSVVVDSGSGFSVIAAPEVITPLDAIGQDSLGKVIALLRKTYAHVVVDLPADWTNWALSLAADSSAILLVTDISISGLRQARRRLDLLSSVGVDPAAIKVIANRMERRFFKTIGVGDVSQALHCDVAAALDDEGAALRSAQDQGLLIGDAAGKTRFGQQVAALARSLCNGGE